MVRIKTNVYSHKRKKRVLKEARGQFGNRSKRYKEAAKSLTASKQYAYYDRKKNKSNFRSLWIIRINAACQELGITYSKFIKGTKNAGIELDRKVLAELAVSAPESFAQIVELAKAADHKKNVPPVKHKKLAPAKAVAAPAKKKAAAVKAPKAKATKAKA
jgi:large subunit ribosomal protein L20